MRKEVFLEQEKNRFRVKILEYSGGLRLVTSLEPNLILVWFMRLLSYYVEVHKMFQIFFRLIADIVKQLRVNFLNFSQSYDSIHFELPIFIS
jgi:hypothetical protein